MIKRILAVILLITTTVISVPVTVWAESVDGIKSVVGTGINNSAVDTDRPVATDVMYDLVYYSDLFYGYDVSYFRSDYITAYASETYDVPFRIYNEYCDDPKFIATGMKLGAECFGNPKTLVDSYSSFFGNDDVTYEKALDAANVKMFEAMFELDSSFYSGFGRNVMKRIRDFNAYVKGFRDGRYNDGSLDGLTDGEKFTMILEDFYSKGIAHEVERHPFNIIVSTIGTDVDKYLEMASACVDILDLCQVVYTGMIMESVRLEVIDYIIAKASSDSELYDGMTRLKSQLRGGFATYFIDQYLVEKVLDKLADAVVKYTLGTVFNTYSFYAAIVNILSAIIFDVIFDVPSLDDLVVQSVLTAYTNELYNIILNKYTGMYKEVFGGNFTYDDIKTFEYIFEMNLAATNACLEATKGLTLDSNKDTLTQCIEKYENVSYTEYIDDIKMTIYNLPNPQRLCKEKGTVTVSAATEIVPASDNIEEGKIYMSQGRVNNNIILKNKLSVASGVETKVDGSVTLSGGSSVLQVDGELEITGGITLDSNGSGYSKLTMTKPDSVLYIGGNFSSASFSCCNISDGKIVFNGTEQQTINYLRAHDIEVTNPKGIKYYYYTYLYGNYDLNGNPLDIGSYNTYWYNGATFTEGSDYKTLYIPNNESVTLEGELKAKVRCDGVLTIEEGKKAKIDSGVTLAGGSRVLQVDGELEITGGITLDSNGSGDSKLTMTKPDSVLYIGGNFSSAPYSGCNISDGKIIFNGSSQQTVNYLTAPTVILENKSSEGVTLKYASVNKLFEHKSNKFTAGYGCSFVDYDGDGIKDNLDPEPTVGPNTVPELSVDNYVVTITAASNIKDIRYAIGEYTKGSEVKAAEGNVAINNALVVKNTVGGRFVYTMPTGGVYTFWVRTVNGGEYFLRADMTHFTPTVSTDGVRITLHDLYNVKDFYIAKGEYETYREIKDNGYIVSISGTKIAGKHDYTYTVYEPGVHTILIRYNDGTQTVFHETLTVDEPVFTTNGLQVTVSNIPDVKVIRTAYGEWNTTGELKATDTIRNFSAKTAIKGKDPYTIQYRDEGMVTVIVEYNNGYVKVFHYEVEKKTPTVEQNGNTVTFGDLDGLNVLRYAEGEYTTVSQIKAATGSKALKTSSIVDGSITVTLETGTYTFCVQYDDESYNYYKIVVE